MTETSRALDAAWLLRLRTTSVLGVLLLVVVAHFGLDQPLPLAPLLAVLALWLATNVAAAAVHARRPRALPDAATAALLALDAVLLTAVLYLTGGPANPFSFLYLVHVALGAVVLPPRLAWGLVALSVSLFGLLFLDHVPLAADDPHAGHAGHAGHDVSGHMASHLRGMWVAFAVAAAFIVTFTSRIRRTLSAHEQELVDVRERAARSERLASLATLAAGAAHELATPLSTIALVAKELETLLDTLPGASEAADDARLIREQVARCRAILDQMRAEAGQPAGEAPTLVTPRALVDAALAELEDRERVQVDVAAELVSLPVRTYARSVAQALRGIVKNALDASPPGAMVQVRCVAARGGLDISVIDRGSGIDAVALARVGEPFFTTKPTGRGMGLGVFLARAVAERLGGRLELSSSPGTGTTALLHLPHVTSPS